MQTRSQKANSGKVLSDLDISVDTVDLDKTLSNACLHCLVLSGQIKSLQSELESKDAVIDRLAAELKVANSKANTVGTMLGSLRVDEGNDSLGTPNKQIELFNSVASELSRLISHQDSELESFQADIQVLKSKINQAMLCVKRNSSVSSASKPKVLFLSDSHGRGCGQMLLDYFGSKYSLFSIFKPNAGFGGVTEGIKDLIADFGVDDHVVVFAGTNDERIQYAFRKHVEYVRQCCQKTNLWLMTIPYRHDDVSLNNSIRDANAWISHCFGNGLFSNLRIFDINQYLSRASYTRHGLHLNNRSKRDICQRFAELIKGFIPGSHISKDKPLSSSAPFPHARKNAQSFRN